MKLILWKKVNDNGTMYLRTSMFNGLWMGYIHCSAEYKDALWETLLLSESDGKHYPEWDKHFKGVEPKVIETPDVATGLIVTGLTKLAAGMSIGQVVEEFKKSLDHELELGEYENQKIFVA